MGRRRFAALAVAGSEHAARCLPATSTRPRRGARPRLALDVLAALVAIEAVVCRRRPGALVVAMRVLAELAAVAKR